MSARNYSFTTPKPCKHLVDYKLKHGLKGYNLIQDSLICGPYGTSMINKPKSEIPRCSFCSGYNGRFYMCLICSSVTCRIASESNHTLLHSESNDSHEIAVDIERAELYCCVCCDQVYDPEFDKAVVCKKMMGLPENGNGGIEGGEFRLSKRKRLDFGADFDLKSVKRLVLRKKQRSKSCFPLGLRGLNNLGNTCFMNSVLQALLHAPPLRNYFLSDKHNHERCCRKSSSDKLCLPCDIDVIFSAVFSGDRSPYSPAKFLYSWWQHSENLASYEQQDAHEFFISVLDGIHEKLGKASHAIKDKEDCQCIAHRVFSGLLRSDLTCTSCGFTSSTYDPCLDISLDLNISASSSSSDFTSKPNETIPVSTLAGSLDLFTRPEKLGSDQKIYCENCREKQNALKQMSIKKLPLVLCLHIKRFEHSTIRKMSRKIDRHLQFPFSLDMNPYLSSSIVKKRFGNRIFSFEGDELDVSTEFEVFAVVTHSGMLESGHYVTYLRLTNQWYRCDDAWITEVDEEVVRASQCYLMFYVQKVICNKGSDDMSCQPVLPLADPFVPIAGYC
ncbi:hypothetical protein RD792_006144 [Penstemon davidsonii]|uniref:Ubiquitinyl hydrolase 1 n=1 Tax=Penstemon davidsonii TaxID=160366 RepID=A0ABR0DDD5_9LAMI|nr:hypothetical protein RD792_008481 [Penstemon davidsonii]KAK4487252.1 hypothetical protein RD792_006144 [Penstemon davidsonii]